MKIEAAARLTQSHEINAAEASVKKAEKFLAEVGFKGLEYKSGKEDTIVFKYSKYDAKKLAKTLGEPKETTKSDSIRYKFAGKGVLVIWPQKNEVKLLNSAKNVK